jgi:hypothetical protein
MRLVPGAAKTKSRGTGRVLTEEDRKCFQKLGWWSKVLNLYVDADLGEEGAEQFKQARLNDYASWIVAASLVMTTDFGILLLSPGDIAEPHKLIDTQSYDSRNIIRETVLHLFLFSISVSAMLSFICMVDTTADYLSMNQIPAKLFPEAYSFVSKVRFAKMKRSWFMCAMGRLGVKFGLQTFFQSVRWLCFGTVCGIYLIHGVTFAGVVAVVFTVGFQRATYVSHASDEACSKFLISIAERTTDHTGKSLDGLEGKRRHPEDSAV